MTFPKRLVRCKAEAGLADLCHVSEVRQRVWSQLAMGEHWCNSAVEDVMETVVKEVFETPQSPSNKAAKRSNEVVSIRFVRDATARAAAAYCEQTSTDKVKVGESCSVISSISPTSNRLDLGSYSRGVTCSEDRIAVIPDFMDVAAFHLSDSRAKVGPRTTAANFAYASVFDGHNGSDAAESCRVMLHHFLAASIGAEPSLKKALVSAYKAANEYLARRHADILRVNDCGTTATTVLVSDATVTVANVGDSAAALFDTTGKNTMLTVNHHVSNQAEAGLVESRRGEIINVMGTPMVEGRLQVTRNLGFQVLDKVICHEPDIVEVPVSETLDYIVVATDGLWDVMSMQDVRLLVNQLRAEFKLEAENENSEEESLSDADAYAEALVEEACSLQAKKDDVAVAVILFG
ncbi:putative protein phosphatase 2C 44 [Diplonema papillatum]|nr:putative protein phosphatase 2C 44 [Diplonema papillatum]